CLELSLSFSLAGYPLLWGLLLPGLSKKPSLSAQGGPVVRSGENVTLLCSSESACDQFHLLREGKTLGHPLAGGRGPHGARQAEFLLGPGTPAHSGVYMCHSSFTHSPYSWSDPSDPLFLSVAGLSKKPSLSAQGGPVVRSGENVTLLCSSESACDQFHLLREGRNLGHPLAGGRGPRGACQADGVYRCYGSFARSPDSWSDPSGPLFLSVARNASNSQPLHAKPNPNSGERAAMICFLMDSGPPAGNPRHLHALIGPSVAFVFLVSLISFLVHHWCPDGKGKSQEEEASARGSRCAPKRPDDFCRPQVTYTDLDCSVFTRKIITPTSQRPREPSADASVYMDLATC
uniref:Immunoglobulin domain-containing protein n=1 Tax=Moschus moschiferus TaxID=68415 RepID=A0A8C6FY71_MOSMO